MPSPRRLSAATGLVARFAADRRGGTAIEYGLIAALVCLAVIGSIAATGGSVSANWSNMGAKVSAALRGS
jgi:pilus assembly protein Flp/PilA